MTFDTATGDALLFGGNDTNGTLHAGTCKFIAGAWTLLTPGHSPSARDGAMLAYDGYPLLYGGEVRGYATMSDTWNFTIGAWQHLTGTTGITSRPVTGGCFVDDTHNDFLVLAVGSPSSSPAKSYTDNFTALRWSAVSYSRTAPKEWDGACAFDPLDGYTVLFGGIMSSGPTGQMWTLTP